MKFDDVFIHPTLASFMLLREPHCDISEEAQSKARNLLGPEQVAFYIQEGILHLWFEPDVSLDCLARFIGEGVAEQLNISLVSTPKSYGIVAEKTVMIIDRLKRAGRI